MSEHLRRQWRIAGVLTPEQIAHINETRDYCVSSGDTNSKGGPSCGYATEILSEEDPAFTQVWGAFLLPDGSHPEHVWLKMADGTIVDPTADQFGFEPIRVVRPGESGYENYLEGVEGDDSVTASLTKEAASPTLWHVTDRANFAVDPAFEPGGGNGEVGLFGAGLFVTPNPELWHYLWRPQSNVGIFAAEVDAPANVIEHLGYPGDDRDQAFIAGKDLDKVTVRRVVPIQQAEAEANRAGYGFAMIAPDVIDSSRICVIDHKAGWGNPEALCGRVTNGDPLKWSTREWVLTGPMKDRICADCVEVLRR